MQVRDKLDRGVDPPTPGRYDRLSSQPACGPADTGFMTLPRMRLPGTTYFVTHAVHDRRFLLTPSPVVNRIVVYCAARAARHL